MNKILTRIIVSALALAAITATAVDFHIAPDGNDGNPGTQDRPFASLERGRNAVRALKLAGPLKEPVNVWLHGGVYQLNQPVVFTPADSGTPDAPITYAAPTGERASLSGGVRLTGAWQQTPGKPFFQLALPQARDGKWIFNSLFVNGQSRIRARYPNYDEKVLRAAGREPGGDPRQALRYFPGDFNPAWSNPQDIDVVLLCSWTPTIHRIKEVIPDRQVVRFESSHVRPVDFWERNFRYYLSNVYEALDDPGEWYLNRHTGVLYYYPLPGEDLAKAEIVAPVLKSTMIEFAGDLGGSHWIEHLHFRDLHFLHVDGDLDRYNGMYRQAHMYLNSAFEAHGLRHTSFERCEFAQLGEYGMELADGCQDVTVRQCHFWDLGAGALQLGVTDLPTLLTPLEAGAKPGRTAESRREVKDLVIDNNCIHRLGTIWHGCYGIGNRFASRTKITHNEIFDTHYIAVGLDARWTWKGEKYSYGNEIAYNHLHNLGLHYQTDAAGIYQFGPLDTHIHHNLIHDNLAYPHIAGFAGIYLDETSRGAVVEDNLVYNVDWYAFFQNYGTDNVIRNNIGAFARNGLLGRGGVSKSWPSNYFEATRNIYITREKTAVERLWDAGTKTPFVHNNMYYGIAGQNTQLTFGGKSFTDWQAAGQDAHSVVGDPGCRNPAAFDFSLPLDAPACKAIGFVPIDDEIHKAGLYGDATWRELPKSFPPRKPAPLWTDEDFKKLIPFALDFNLMKDGDDPGVFHMQGEKGAGFAVTSEVPGLKGAKCLKCIDKKGLSKAFYPYLQYAPHGLNSGNFTFAFAVRQPASAPARLDVTLRSSGEKMINGPSLNIGRDGGVKASGQIICTLKPGEWTQFEMRLTLGDAGNGHYTLVTRNRAGETSHSLPYANPAFSDIGWIGVTMPDDADGVTYLDDLKLQITK